MDKVVNSRKHKLALNAAIALCYFAFGVNYNLLGNTVTDFNNITGIDQAQFSYVFMLRSGIYCLGAIFLEGAWLPNFFNRQLLFGFNMLLLGVSMCLTPFFPRFEYILTNQAVVGFASGGIDIATNVLIMEMWEENSNTFLQATHLCYAIGSTASPMIAAPFLLDTKVYTNKTSNNGTLPES
ncbi:sodium-dependent glucose transporter 1-like protein, partial [Dinothrombium tinctorium]